MVSYAAFCGEGEPDLRDFGAAGRNPPSRELASTLTSRSHGILQLFKEQRHVSGGAPIRAHFPFMYCSGLLQGFVGVQKRETALSFYAWIRCPRFGYERKKEAVHGGKVFGGLSCGTVS